VLSSSLPSSLRGFFFFEQELSTECVLPEQWCLVINKVLIAFCANCYVDRRFFLGTAKYESFVHWDAYIPSLGTESVTEEHIYQISPDVGRSWKDLLRSLSVKEKTIENLSVDFTHAKITEQCILGLIKWKELSPHSATIKTLALALRDVGCFDALRTLQKLR